MKVKKFSEFEKLVLFFSFLGAAATLYLFVNDEWTTRDFENIGQASIGKVSSVQNNARVKRKNSISWQKAYKTTPLYFNDKIFTGADSKLGLAIKQGDVELGENSIIIIENYGEQPVLGLFSGNFQLNLKKNQKVTLESNGKKIELKSTMSVSKVEVSANDSGAKLSGSGVKVKVEGKNFTLGKSDIVEVSKKKVKKKAFKVTLNGVDPAKREKGQPLELSWIALEPLEGAKIEVSKDPEFAKVEREISANEEGKVEFTPKGEGKFYWRMVDNTGAEISKKANFPVSFKLASVDLFIPKITGKGSSGPLTLIKTSFYDKIHQKTLRFSSKDKKQPRVEVPLHWKKVPDTKNYRVFLSKNKSGTPIISKKSVSSNKTNFRFRYPGKYYARVASLSGDIVGPMSEPAKIEIDSDFKIFRPRAYSPRNKMKVLSFAQKGTEPIVFHWKKVKYAEEYELQISKNKRFSKLITEYKGNKNSFLLNLDGNGAFYWRIRSLRGEILSKWSPAYTFYIQPAKLSED